jgi:hypothetical protein
LRNCPTSNRKAIYGYQAVESLGVGGKAKKRCSPGRP